MPTIAFYTLGCRSNQYETDVMSRQASSLGFEIVPYRAAADIYVINTCTVTGNAGKKSRNYIRQAKKMNPNAKVIATGCDVEIDNIPEADLILPNKDKSKLSSYLKPLISSNSSRSSFRLPVRANLMIEDGCENFCSYCIVPFVRGKVRSRPVKVILDEAREMVKAGVKEIVLTGINIGEFGMEPETKRLGSISHAELVSASQTLKQVQGDTKEPRLQSQVHHLVMLIALLSKIKGLLRIRLSSIEPQYVTDELVETIKNNPKVCHHLHMPLQSGDDGVLKAMKRRYTAKGFCDLVSGVRKKIKDIAITTDIIVGFPGETEQAFKNTRKLIEKIKFSRLHIFSYSDRPGTAASKLNNKVDSKIIGKRYDLLTKIRVKQMLSFDKRYKGKLVEVLVESRNKSGKYEGLTGNYIRVGLSGPLIIGELHKARLNLSDIMIT